MTRKEVRTKRLVIRPLKRSDYAAWFDAFTKGHPAQNKWDLTPRTRKASTPSIYEKMLNLQHDLAAGDQYYRWYVFRKSNCEIIGHIDFQIFARGSLQFANFGYQIYNRHWGMGYGQEAAKAGLQIGFQQLKLNRLEGAINIENKKSIRLAKKIGMKKECVRKRYWKEEGKWIDHLIYVALKGES